MHFSNISTYIKFPKILFILDPHPTHPPTPNKTNEMLNHFLLAGEKFKPNLGLQIQAFVDHLLKTYRIQKFKEKGYSKYVYHNEFDRGFFQHDMTYGVFKDLLREQIKHSVLLKIQNMTVIKKILLHWFRNCLIKILLLRVQVNLLLTQEHELFNVINVKYPLHLKTAFGVLI